MIPNSKEKQSFLQTSGQDAGTQCLSRTRSVFSRAQSASRAYGGRTASFRAYGGHKVSLAPTASPKEANCEEFAFRSISGKPYRSKKNHLKTGSHPSASAVKKKSIE